MCDSNKYIRFHYVRIAIFFFFFINFNQLLICAVLFVRLQSTLVNRGDHCGISVQKSRFPLFSQGSKTKKKKKKMFKQLYCVLPTVGGSVGQFLSPPPRYCLMSGRAARILFGGGEGGRRGVKICFFFPFSSLKISTLIVIQTISITSLVHRRSLYPGIIVKFLERGGPDRSVES